MAEIYDTNHARVKAFFACGKKNIEMVETLVREYKPLFMGKRFLTDAELSVRIGISRRTLQDFRDRGVLPFYRLDGKVLYEESDIEAFLSSIYIPKF